MIDIHQATLTELAAALRQKRLSAVELTETAIRAHESTDSSNHAYKLFDAEGALQAARTADERLARDADPPPFCGVPVSVKDLYGVQGLPTFAGTAHRLPEKWEADAWLVGRLREQNAVFTGKTHTVELAFGAVGINSHWDTPRNPWDAETHRIPGGSSAGAGVSLWAGSALLALGSDTGGSVRIPASLTGTVGHRTTIGRWPTTGVVPLSTTLDTVGGLTRSVADSAFFFGSIDPAWGDPGALLQHLNETDTTRVRLAVPRCQIWSDCQADIATVIERALRELTSSGWTTSETDGGLLDDASDHYLTGGIGGAECLAFIDRELPQWLEVLDPVVGKRLEGSPALDSEAYSASITTLEGMVARSDDLFDSVDLLALPTAIITPPAVSDLEDLDRYIETNRATLRPTGPVSMLGLCALTVPVGLDETGMPVGLQLVAPGGRDELLLAAGLAAERVLGTPSERLGAPPRG
jgi:aspartyl-tRNA(Asn)/glutamyl-tRNA(Gln) amidotransferase subunit A